MRAWTTITACGTPLWIKTAAKARDLRQGDIHGVARSAAAFASGMSGADYLAAVNKIHAYGREMAAAYDEFDIILSATLAEPPAQVGRFIHVRDDNGNHRVGAGGVFEYSPFCAAFNASGQPAASLPLHRTPDGLPVRMHLAAAFGADATLIAECSQLEQTAPWAHQIPPMLAEYLA